MRLPTLPHLCTGWSFRRGSCNAWWGWKGGRSSKLSSGGLLTFLPSLLCTYYSLLYEFFLGFWELKRHSRHLNQSLPLLGEWLPSFWGRPAYRRRLQVKIFFLWSETNQFLLYSELWTFQYVCCITLIRNFSGRFWTRWRRVRRPNPSKLSGSTWDRCFKQNVGIKGKSFTAVFTPICFVPFLSLAPSIINTSSNWNIQNMAFSSQ